MRHERIRTVMENEDISKQDNGAPDKESSCCASAEVNWSDPAIPAGNAPAMPLWPLMISAIAFIAWLAFLVFMAYLRMSTTSN